MELQLSKSTSTISLANLVRATNGQGKVRFPVKTSDLAYANFKNIKIVPSGSGRGSYSVSRLRALDNLIEQLNRMQGRYTIKTQELDVSNPDTLNILIKKFSEKIHTSLDSNSIYSPLVDFKGLLVNMLL